MEYSVSLVPIILISLIAFHIPIYHNLLSKRKRTVKRMIDKNFSAYDKHISKVLV